MLRLDEEHHVSSDSALVSTSEHLRQSSKVNRSFCRLSDGSDVADRGCRRMVVAALPAARNVSAMISLHKKMSRPPAGKAPTKISLPKESRKSVASSSGVRMVDHADHHLGEYGYNQDVHEESCSPNQFPNPTDSKFFIPKWSVRIGDSVEDADVAFQMARRVVTPKDIVRLGMLPDSSLHHQMAHVLMQAVAFNFEATNRAEIARKRIQEMEESHAHVISMLGQESEKRERDLQEKSSEVDRLRAELERTKVLVAEAEARAAKAVEEYKASPEFHKELMGYTRDSYLAGVVDSRRLVRDVLPSVDLGFFHQLSRSRNLDELEKEMVESAGVGVIANEPLDDDLGERNERETSSPNVGIV